MRNLVLRCCLGGILIMAALASRASAGEVPIGHVYIGELKNHVTGKPTIIVIKKDLKGKFSPSTVSPLELTVVLQRKACEVKISVMPLGEPDVTSLHGRIEKLYGKGCPPGYNHGFVIGNYEYVDSNHIEIKPYFIVTTVEDKVFDNYRFKLNK